MKHLYSCLLFIITIQGISQNQDSIPQEEVIIPRKQYPFLKVELGFGALSNSLSTVELADFVTDNFLDNEEKDQLLSSIPSALRYGYIRSYEGAYFEPGYSIYDVYKQGWGIGLRNTYYNSATLNKDMLNLMFYGNKPFAGTSVDAGKSALETWYFSSLDYHFEVMLDTLLPLKLTTSIHAGHNHRDYLINKAEIYTDSIGEYLDTDLDYSTQEANRGSFPLAGLGLSVSGAIELPIKKAGKLNLEVNDLGVMFWNNGEVLRVDSAFRFQGVYFDNIFDLNDSIREHATDEYRKALYYSESKNYLKLMPFQLSAMYTHSTQNSTWLREVFVGANYRYLPGYFPQLLTGATIKTGYKQRLTTTLTVGGYTWAGLDVGYYFEIGYDWKIALAIHNINGLIIPVMSGGTFGTLSVSYRL